MGEVAMFNEMSREELEAALAASIDENADLLCLVTAMDAIIKRSLEVNDLCTTLAQCQARVIDELTLARCIQPLVDHGVFAKWQK
jgi:environmental stress-induced protein Ves